LVSDARDNRARDRGGRQAVDVPHHDLPDLNVAQLYFLNHQNRPEPQSDVNVTTRSARNVNDVQTRGAA
jgi:hypothetical protein